MKITKKFKNEITEKLKNIHDVPIEYDELNQLIASEKYQNIMDRTNQMLDAMQLMINHNISMHFLRDDRLNFDFEKYCDDQSREHGRIVYEHNFDPDKPGYPWEIYHMKITKDMIRYTWRCDRMNEFDVMIDFYNVRKIKFLIDEYINEFDKIEEFFWTSVNEFLNTSESE